MIGVTDMKQAGFMKTKSNLFKGKTLLFTHGFAIHFDLTGYLVGQGNHGCTKGSRHIVRSQFKAGVPLNCGVEGIIERFKPRSSMGSWCRGCQCGILQTTFKEETETDLFGEQAVL